MDLKVKLESLLFVAGKPLKISALAKILETGKDDVKNAAEELAEKYGQNSGVILIENAGEFQLASNPSCAKFTDEFVKEEISGPLTRPQLETLTIIAYAGPVPKLTIEQVRGVNCSLILRNLMIRGLVEETEAKYNVTMDFLRHMGLSRIVDLPDYEKLRNHESLKAMTEGL